MRGQHRLSLDRLAIDPCFPFNPSRGEDDWAPIRRADSNRYIPFHTEIVRRFLTAQKISLYSAWMDEGLRALEEKISQITQLNARLRDEAQTLRQQLAAANNEIARQQDKLETARTRITDMLARLPSEEV